MFRFAYPIYLYLLALIVVFAILHYLGFYLRRKRIARYGDPELVKQLFVDVSLLRVELKFWLCMAAYAMFVLALARPQNGTKKAERDRYGIEAVVALDISNSMMAQDVTPSRLDKSKLLITNMMNEMPDDQMGLVIFAGDAFVQLPITSDFATAKMFLDQVNPSMIEIQGTDVARAIELSSRSFTPREDVNRAIFIITDGEDNEGGAVEAAKEAAEKGIHVFVLGVGKPDGTHVPIPGSTGYMIDEHGQEVLSRLNEEMCKEIADAGKGAYIYVDNSSSAQDLLNKQIDKLSKSQLDKVAYEEYNEKFQLFLMIGIVLLLLDVLILARENHLFKKITLFKDKTTVLFLLGFLLLAASCSSNSNRDFLRRGNRYYREAKSDTASLDKAITEYQKSLEVDTLAQALYNKGVALLHQFKDSTALEDFKKAARRETSPQRLSHIYHNMGVLLQAGASVQQQDKQKLLADAIECYKEALRNDPTDNESRYDLALCQWQMKNDSGDDQNQNQDQDNKDQGGDGSNNDDQQNKNNDQQNKDKDSDSQQQNQQQQQQNNNQQQNNGQQQQQEISKDAAEQLLNAAMQNERQAQDRINRYYQRKAEQEQGQASQRRLQKNW